MNPPFKAYVYNILRNPFKRIVFVSIALPIIAWQLLFIDPEAWLKKFEAGEKEHKSDFLTEVDHKKELKAEVHDFVSYLLGLCVTRKNKNTTS